MKKMLCIMLTLVLLAVFLPSMSETPSPKATTNTP